jgi:hypothetical protein
MAPRPMIGARAANACTNDIADGVVLHGGENERLRSVQARRGLRVICGFLAAGGAVVLAKEPATPRALGRKGPTVFRGPP